MRTSIAVITLWMMSGCVAGQEHQLRDGRPRGEATEHDLCDTGQWVWSPVPWDTSAPCPQPYGEDTGDTGDTGRELDTGVPPLP